MKYTLTLVLLALSLVAKAQQKKWTLEECVNYAVENNLSIEQIELDLESAVLDINDAKGARLPNLNAGSSFSGNTGLILDPTTNNLVSGQIFSVSGDVTSSVNLFNGLRTIHRINQAKMSKIAAQYQVDDMKDDIRLAVANAYLQVISNKEALKVAQAQYAVTEQDLKRTNELVVSGVVPEGDLLEIEATAANQEQQIVNTQNSVLISRISLAQLLQITDYQNFDIVDESFDVPPSEVLVNSPKEIFAKALEWRNDIKLSEANVALAEKEIQIAKGARYPTLGAFFNYNTRYSDQTRDAATGQKISFRNQLWINDGISYGAQLNIPIFNGFSVRNNIARAEIGVNRARLQLEQDKLTLETDINQAYVNVQNSAKTFEAAQKTVKARRLAFNYAKERFEVGLMNAFAFSQAQAQVDDAEAQLIRTKYDYIFRIKILEFYFGLPVRLD